MEEDLAKLLSHLVQGMQSSSILNGALGGKVVRLEVGRLPAARLQHLGREICHLDRNLLCKLGAFLHRVVDDFGAENQLALLQVGELFAVGHGLGVGHALQRLACRVLGRVDQRHQLVAILFDPFGLEGVALAYFCAVGAY